jgi:hypothetical protein
MTAAHKQILCPYCLTEIRYRKEVTECANPKCAKELPIQYIQNYERAAPFFVQLIGWSAVGKTVYLQALTLMLMQMGKFWRNYSYSPLTEQTLGYVQNVREFLSKGAMPQATQLALQEAYVMLLLGMSRWGGRTLVSRDVAGEVFNKFQFPVEYTPYLLHVPTTFLMVSLHDLKEFPEKSMDQLMTSFIETMAKYERGFRKEQRKLVVVFSKADKIFDELPFSLQEYLQTDPLLTALNLRQPVQPLTGFGMQRYMENLANVSRQIEDWISEESAGRNLIMQARNNNIQLEFTIVSSTGADVDTSSNTLGVTLQPTRVLDPYFWALDFQSEP